MKVSPNSQAASEQNLVTDMLCYTGVTCTYLHAELRSLWKELIQKGARASQGQLEPIVRPYH